MGIFDEMERERAAALDPAPGAAVAATDPGTLAVPYPQLIEQLLAPHTVSMETWLRSLVLNEDFGDETATDESVVGILAQILTARTSEEALATLELDRAKAMAGGEPGGHSPLLEIRAARPMKSRFDEGSPVYVIVDAVYVHNGEAVRFTTGAKAVQAAIAAHIGNNWMPFQAVLEIRRTPTTAGYYPLNLVAGG